MLLSSAVGSAQSYHDTHYDYTGTGRYGHGFTSAGGKLFVHGGFSSPAGNNGPCYIVVDRVLVRLRQSKPVLIGDRLDGI